jgi:ribosome-binding protein aMBF1 (putative translation factor)
MLASTKSEDEHLRTEEFWFAAGSAPAFDRDLALKIGKSISVRRKLCGLSRQQLAARVGIDSAEVEAYEQGAKRISCSLLLQTAKQLNANPRFFFQ